MKKTRVQQMSLEITVGFFVLLVIAGLGWFTILLSPTIGKATNEMEVEFGNVTGLLKGDKVYLQGVDIGRVKKMEIDRQRVIVTLTLKHQLKLHQGYQIAVEASSVLGGRYVGINEGDLSKPEIAAGEKIYGRQPIDFLGQASEAVRSVREALEDGGILRNIQQTLVDITNITADVRAGRGTLGKLLKSEEAYDKLIAIETNLLQITTKLNNGEGTIGRLLNDDSVYTNLAALSASLRDVSDKLAKGEGTLGKLINDDTVYTNLTAISADLRDVSDRLANGQGTLGKLLSTNDTLHAELYGAVSNINAVAANIAAGKGSLGKLVNNDELYNEVRSMIGEVRAAIDDLRETSPVATFSSVFLGAF